MTTTTTNQSTLRVFAVIALLLFANTSQAYRGLDFERIRDARVFCLSITVFSGVGMNEPPYTKRYLDNRQATARVENIAYELARMFDVPLVEDCERADAWLGVLVSFTGQAYQIFVVATPPDIESAGFYMPAYWRDVDVTSWFDDWTPELENRMYNEVENAIDLFFSIYLRAIR